ncbi:MAG: hypothetical protein QM597_08165, partial [Aeromicrobium sp.]|uniref:hypothetical protein n=1 Tax=Aeromicrobium sp. TaxID=1871063 RepID=UPI0039E728BB
MPHRVFGLVRHVVVLALVTIAAFVGLGATGANAAGIWTNISPQTYGGGYQIDGNITFYAYVEEGEYIQFWGGGSAQVTLTKPNGETETAAANSTSMTAVRQVGAGEAGVWTVSEPTEIYYWAFTVWDGNPGSFTGNPQNVTLPTGVSEITGRVWVETYNIDQSSARAVNFWMLNDTGYQYSLRLLNYNGINSTIVANSMGLPAGTSGGLECTPSYKSKEQTDPALDMSCADPYRLFFEEPADDLPVTAPIWVDGAAGTQVIKPDPVDPTTLTADDFDFTPTSASTSAGTFSYDLGDSFFGGHLLQIDVNNDGDYDDSVDRSIRVGAAGEPVEYEFDGLDGEGNAIEPCT